MKPVWKLTRLYVIDDCNVAHRFVDHLSPFVILVRGTLSRSLRRQLESGLGIRPFAIRLVVLILQVGFLTFFAWLVSAHVPLSQLASVGFGLIVMWWSLQRFVRPSRLDYAVRLYRALIRLGMCPHCAYQFRTDDESKGTHRCPECGGCWS